MNSSILSRAIMTRGESMTIELIIKCPPFSLLMDLESGLARTFKVRVVNGIIFRPINVLIDVEYTRLISASGNQMSTSIDQVQGIKASRTEISRPSMAHVSNNTFYFNHPVNLMMTTLISQSENVYQCPGIAPRLATLVPAAEVKNRHDDLELPRKSSIDRSRPISTG